MTTPRHRAPRPTAGRMLAALVALAATAAVAWAVTGSSSAAFTSSSGGLGVVRAASDWTPPTVTLQAPPTHVRGTVTLTAQAADADSGVARVEVQGRVAGTSTWTSIRTLTSSPWTFAYDTAGVPTGSYELRAIATDEAGNTATSSVVGTVVDNTAPTVTMTDPGSPLSGTHRFAATASDAHSGVASVALEASADGSTWTTLGTRTSAPYSIDVDTRTLTSDRATYFFRAVATDVVGNVTTSTPVTDRVVDNVVTTVSLADPGAYLYGTVPLRATGSSTAGVQSVAIQRAPAGTSNWSSVGTRTAAPYTVDWNTTSVADGLYDLRAVLTDSKGRTTASEIVGSRRVHNAPLTGVDIQTINGGTPGRPDEGDEVVYTFNREVDPGSIVSGWDGSTRSVTAVMSTGWFGSRSGLDVDGTNLGLVDLGARYQFSALLDTHFRATVTATTQTVDGIGRTVVTVRFTNSPLNVWTVNDDVTMQWTPTSALRDLMGRAASTAAVTESGAADRDF